MTGRLDDSKLAALASRAQVPSYNRDDIDIGIVHLGLSATHRCHQAVYTDAAIGLAGGDWGICGVSMGELEEREALLDQDCLYTVVSRQDEVSSFRVVGALMGILVAPECPATVIAFMAKANIHVITLTVGELGYCLNQATGQLDPTHPDMLHDRQQPGAPRSAIGLLVAAMQRRQQQGGAGFTVISCDNIAGNGLKLHRAVMEYASWLDPDLPVWVEANCCFPCSIADRIVPAAVAADRTLVRTELGIVDRAAQLTEAWSQWVIEDKFAGPVPNWQLAGAQIVRSVAPFEEMKLRLMNASHSALAYLGCLAGFRTVADAIAEPALAQMIRQMTTAEMTPTLADLDDFDLAGYQRALLLRFANRGLQHHCRQIAMNGSQKIPQRLLPALRWQLRAGAAGAATSLALAAWIRYTRGVDDQGRSFDLRDPLAHRLAELHTLAGPDPERYLEAVLALDTVFDAELAANTALREQLLGWLVQLEAEGALQCARAHWGEPLLSIESIG